MVSYGRKGSREHLGWLCGNAVAARVQEIQGGPLFVTELEHLHEYCDGCHGGAKELASAQKHFVLMAFDVDLHDLPGIHEPRTRDIVESADDARAELVNCQIEAFFCSHMQNEAHKTGCTRGARPSSSGF